MVSGDTEAKGGAQPPIIWAQRRHLVFVTINVEDCQDPEIKVEGTRLHFRGMAGPDKRLFETDLELYGEVDPEKSKQQVSDRNIQLALMRKEEGAYWPRLLKASAKVHWLKVDFSKWRDEDESDDEEGAPGQDMNLEQMMQQMGGLGGGAGDGSKPTMDDVLSDSDDEEDDGPMPDLEQ